ncbi:MAG: thioesterase family protein [Pseudomonadota bacterium]|nr:thioesterase family protein [Pseudomonadota bacterium]
MNLYFRMLRILFMLWRDRARQDPYQPTTANFRVWPLDMDINIHMNNARYLSIMDLGRIYHMGKAGLLRQVFKHKWMPVVAKIDIRYIRAIGPFEKFTLKTEMTGHDDKYFHMKQTFMVNNREVAVANLKGLFLDKKGRKLPSDVVLSHLPELQ